MVSLDFCFVTSGLKFSGNSLEEGSLGGSETALLYMACELQRKGHSVVVFCNCTQEGTFEGVAYFDRSRFEHYVLTSSIDILIVSRWAEYLTVPVNVGLRVLWLHDMLTDKDRLMGTVYQTDLIMLLSNFHMEDHLAKLPQIKPILWQTRNGIDLQTVRENIRPKVPKKAIYTSRPERGLPTLLVEILPRLLKEEPDFKLYIAGYDIQGIPLSEHCKLSEKISREYAARYPNNVVWLGSLTKAELYQEISSSELLLYPTGFPEISCLSVLEAQACGTAVVTTNNLDRKSVV